MPTSDFVFFDGHHPDEIFLAKNPTQKGRWYHSQYLNPETLSMLGQLLEIDHSDVLLKEFEMIYPPNGVSFLFAVPEALQKRLRLLTDEEILSVVPKWGKIKEFDRRVPFDFLKEFLNEIREFLSSKNEQVYLFLSV